MPLFSLVVETGDLLKALRATTAFTEPKFDHLARVRIIPGDHVSLVQASNGVASALALVSTLSYEHASDERSSTCLDLTLGHVAAITSVFKASRAQADEDGMPAEELTIDVDDEAVRILDSGGLFTGRKLDLEPIAPEDHTPSVQRIAARTTTTPASLHPTRGSALHGAALAGVVKASKIYGHAIVVEPHAQPTLPGARPVVLFSVGEDFLAVVAEDTDEERVAQRSQWRSAWTDRLSATARSTPEEELS